MRRPQKPAVLRTVDAKVRAAIGFMPEVEGVTSSVEVNEGTSAGIVISVCVTAREEKKLCRWFAKNAGSLAAKAASIPVSSKGPVVGMDDRRIEHFVGAYPETTYAAASLLRLRLEEAEVKGRSAAETERASGPVSGTGTDVSTSACVHMRQLWRGKPLPCADLDCPDASMGAVLVMETMETADAGTRWEFPRRLMAGSAGSWWIWDPPSSTPVDFAKLRDEAHARTMQYIVRNV